VNGMLYFHTYAKCISRWIIGRKAIFKKAYC
jgi:hypothetical protein